MNDTKLLKNKQQQLEIRLFPFLDLFIFGFLIKHEKELKKLPDDKELIKLYESLLKEIVLNDFFPSKRGVDIADEILSKKQLYRVQYYKGGILVRFGEFKEAEKCLEAAINMKPNSNKLNRNMAYLQKMQGNFEKALHYFKISIVQKPFPFLFLDAGLVCQSLQNHNEAIEYFTQAHGLNPDNEKIYIAKMQSYKEICKYEEAIECSTIIIALNPSLKLEYLQKKQFLFELSGKQVEANQIKTELEEVDQFYSIKTFQQKRELENEKSLLIKKQSTIKFKPQTQSKIISNKIQIACKDYFDAFYYTFSLFFIKELKLNINFDQIIKNLKSKKQCVEFEGFTESIIESIQILYPNSIQQEEIFRKLKLWYENKIQPKIQTNFLEDLCEYITQISQSQQINQLIADRIGETLQQKTQRINKQNQLATVITSFAFKASNEKCEIYNSEAAQLGLEHTILLLAYLIVNSSLHTDQESFDNLIFRFITQNDIMQCYIKQPNCVQIKEESSQLINQDQQQEAQMARSSIKKQATIQAIEYLTKIKLEKQNIQKESNQQVNLDQQSQIQTTQQSDN